MRLFCSVFLQRVFGFVFLQRVFGFVVFRVFFVVFSFCSGHPTACSGQKNRLLCSGTLPLAPVFLFFFSKDRDK